MGLLGPLLGGNFSFTPNHFSNRRVFSILDKSTCGHILTILEMIRSHFFFFLFRFGSGFSGFSFFCSIFLLDFILFRFGSD